jgi:hypothetical protein
VLSSAPGMTPPSALHADQIEDLRQSFGARW